MKYAVFWMIANMTQPIDTGLRYNELGDCLEEAAAQNLILKTLAKASPTNQRPRETDSGIDSAIQSSTRIEYFCAAVAD